LWDDKQLHYQLQLVERESRRVLEDSIEIHTVELAKYNGGVGDVREASVLEQWAYWIKNASEHTVEELRDLLPRLEFLRATGELNAIGEITEEKHMYDSREKASLDIESNLIDARQEGRQEGCQEGRQGQSVGRVKAYQELLGDSVASDEELTRMTSEQLTSTIADLQTRLRKRNA